jgi:ABC-type multidrug transport system fused ATPase/permease subunit
MENESEIFAYLLIALAVIFGFVRAFFDIKHERESSRQVEKAEAEAFMDDSHELEHKLNNLKKRSGTATQDAITESLILEAQRTLSMGRLFNVYSKQSDKYQLQTRSRATWSFFLAIIAMIAGLGFVFWGGMLMLDAEDQEIQLAAGGIISVIGGAVSAFITKTFLDVHKLSLTQLNRYFRQPVINGHIMMAQRLAEEIGDEDSRKIAYESLIKSVTKLIGSPFTSPDPDEDAGR